MTLLSGFRLGPYEIESPVGSGGMGEVYKARDTRLDRTVAIKVLPGHVAADPLVRARFEREARAISRLNHPHICALHDVGSQDGIDFLIMEYLDGETLADRIARGPVSLTETLNIATQIAEALEAAHDKGIVHRDLKPANVKITSGVHVKVLDFGIAKIATAAAGADVSISPTVMPTALGTIMGTAAYMSPERAKGSEADRDCDVWAFGCVLYEMLTAHRAFEGDTTSEILANVLKTEPDWNRLPAETPDGIRRLLRRSLQKEQQQRLRDFREARLEIVDAKRATATARTRGRSGRWKQVGWTSALALVALITGMLGARAFRETPTASEVRLDINTPPTRDASLAISPDGLKIVSAGTSEDQSQLWLRSLDSPVPRALAGTDGASLPFWSPDNRSIGFFADAQLKKVNLEDGSIQTLLSTPSGGGGAWSSEGTILVSTNPGRPILRIPAGGGEPTAVTRFESPRQRSQSFPQFLPDQRHFLFFVTGSAEARGVHVGQLDRLETKRLFDADTPAVYEANGHLLFVREGQLLAQRFDLARLEVTGEAVAIAERMNRTAVSASAAGPLAYRTLSPDSGQRQLVWVDRSGRETEKVVYPDTSSPGSTLSHDGRRVAVFRYAKGNMDIWTYDTGRRAWSRVTFDSGDDIFPIWSPDDSRMVFGSRRGEMNLYWKLLKDPPGSEELLLSTSEAKFPSDWSPDGRFLLYDAFSPKGSLDMWALPLEGARTPFEIVHTEFNERMGQFSPDGKWIAYQSDKTGRFEIYVRPFRGPGDDVPVSSNGGTQVRWSPRGEELFYLAGDDRLMAVPVRVRSNTTTFEAGTARWLSGTKMGGTDPNTSSRKYMVTPDGQSFVLNSTPEEATASPITVILNWKPKDGR
jgi:eukaryotic-like serine/threonine-protein kinase